MKRIIFLLPPSEGKQVGGNFKKENITFNFKKPCDIAVNVTQKDLKCKGVRFEEGLELNKYLCEGKQKEFLEAINRYSGVMYGAIDYDGMTDNGKEFFENNFMIFSGMYGILKPLNIIGNYKLPLEKADLYKFWWDKIPEKIIDLKVDYIVNLLPINYAKLIGLGTNCNRHKKKLEKILNAGIKVININFLSPHPNPLLGEEREQKVVYKKISHGVKKIKGEWIKNICEKNIVDYKSFGGEIVENGSIIDVNIIIK